MTIGVNKVLNIPPVALTTSIANLLNSASTTITGNVGYTQTQPYIIVTHINIVNYSSSAVTFTLYKGVTASSQPVAGDQIIGGTQTIAANSSFPWYGKMRIDAADFISGIASAGTALVVQFEAEIGMS